MNTLDTFTIVQQAGGLIFASVGWFQNTGGGGGGGGGDFKVCDEIRYSYNYLSHM